MANVISIPFPPSQAADRATCMATTSLQRSRPWGWPPTRESYPRDSFPGTPVGKHIIKKGRTQSRLAPSLAQWSEEIRTRFQPGGGCSRPDSATTYAGASSQPQRDRRLPAVPEASYLEMRRHICSKFPWSPPTSSCLGSRTSKTHRSHPFPLVVHMEPDSMRYPRQAPALLSTASQGLSSRTLGVHRCIYRLICLLGRGSVTNIVNLLDADIDPRKRRAYQRFVRSGTD